ncbi:hypothetical protein SCHPADRAFT_823938 [Schizopora paradoxa]|uniref:Uncharacterized protein n=1 Tax=Schizopora paradoxa TaxID=27342 RepID=A0A0H2RVU1_9AGAM|nr:hypothetical protein SCHPADRAFT_823938 [Schizopora paradoxa]
MDTCLVIPVSFLGSNSGHSKVKNELEPTSIASWGLPCSYEGRSLDGSHDGPCSGALVGWDDGSISLLHPNILKPPSPHLTGAFETAKSTDSSTLHTPSSSRYPHHLSLSLSRPQSPPSGGNLLAPMPVSKSRAVSSVSKDQAEAPKNYVDFEEEEVKLKQMLGDRAVRDRSSVEVNSLLPDRKIGAGSPRLGHAKSTPSLQKNSLLEDTMSIISTRSIAVSPSPSSTPRIPGDDLTLKSRIISRANGEGQRVTSLEVLESGRFFASLHKTGLVSIFKSLDGVCVASAEPGDVPSSLKVSTISNVTGSQTLWVWNAMHVLQVSSDTVIATVADVDPLSFEPEDESANRSRICFYEVSSLLKCEFGETVMEKVGDYILDGKASHVGTYQQGDGELTFYMDFFDSYSRVDTILFYLDASSQLKLHTVRLGAHSSDRELHATEYHLLHSNSAISFSLPLANTLLRRDSPEDNEGEEDQGSRLSLTPVPVVGTMNGGCAMVVGLKISVVWNDETLVRVLLVVRVSNIMGLRVSLNIAQDRIDTYAAQCISAETKPPSEVMEVGSNGVQESPTRHRYQVQAVASLKLNPFDIFCYCDVQRSQILTSRVRRSGLRVLELQSPRKFPSASTKPNAKPLWTSSPPEKSAIATPRITAMLPLELSLIILAYSNGRIERSSLTELVLQTDAVDLDPAFDAAILSLHIVRRDHPRQSVIIGGGDDGSINFWDFSSLKLHARSIAFVEPLTGVCYVEEEGTGKLRGCSLCISQDGTIAVVAMDALEILYLIPGSPSALRAVHISSENIMLSYGDGRSRLWDIRTREFFRSMSSDKSIEYLGHGHWYSPSLEDGCLSLHSSLSVFNKSSFNGEPPPLLMIDIPRVIEGFSNELSSTSTENVSLVDLKAILAIILRPGIDSKCDKLMASIVGVPEFRSAHMNFQMAAASNVHGVWQVSPEVTAVRLLSAVVLLRLLSNEGGHDGAINDLIQFFTRSLPEHIGSLYQAPSLAFLAFHWTESPVADIRSGAKVLFEAEVERLPDEEIMTVVEKWQHRLPSVLPDLEKQSKRSALALCVCGNIAIDRYNLLSASTLTDIAKSIGIYLYDETSPYRALAIDLCSRGFGIWQSYFDAMEALRSLFTLATSSRKEAVSIRNPGPQARLAVLQIASSNSPLFVTTLSLDIMHPRSVEYSKSVMQVIAFLIRKKPLVLYPSLPRLLEAVVKSLDPGNSSGREAVIDTVTEILGFVVRNFPTVDFSANTQRLAVGTSEGAVIMYDLKTATRLYVLEGHKKRLTGISFSPDGRRLVTLSLEESVLLVWKVGSSFTSIFYPGAPPRQGHGGSDPYKTITFKTGSETPLSLEDTFAQVKFEWPGDRSVKVKIQDSVFTINT